VIPIALLLLAACRGERVETARVETGGVVRASAPSLTSKILGPDGAELVSIAEASGTVEIKFGGKTIRGTTKDSGKRKYEDFEIKPGDEGFKLRTKDGKLRWKVKIKDDKVKVSDNEENKNPFELKSRDGDRIKVVAPGDREVGNVRSDHVEDASGKTLYKVDGPRAAYGVLLLDSIPETERYILVAELLSRKR